MRRELETYIECDSLTSHDAESVEEKLRPSLGVLEMLASIESEPSFVRVKVGVRDPVLN